MRMIYGKYQKKNCLKKKYISNECCIPYFEKTIHSSDLYYGNLEIMKNELFDKCCTMIFGVFDMLEKKIAENNYFINPLKEMFLV